MDELDAMIIRELQWRPADPHHQNRGPRRLWDAARVLGLHGTTVKRRLAAMKEEGLLRGIYVQPAPALVGKRGVEHHLHFADAAAKRRALETVFASPSVWTVYGLVGNEIMVQSIVPDGDLHATARELARETGATDVRFHHLAEWPVPVEKISALDLRVLAAFADDAFRPISEVADEVGIAAKTVTTRLRSLANAKAFMMYPLVDYTKVAGGIAVYLDLRLKMGATEQAHVEIANRFPLALCRSSRGAENGYVVCQTTAASHAEDMIRRAETIPGVEQVRMSLLNEALMEPARWKDALLARAEELARAKGIWAASWRARPVAVDGVDRSKATQ